MLPLLSSNSVMATQNDTAWVAWQFLEFSSTLRHIAVYRTRVNNVGTNLRYPTVEYTAEDFSFLMSTNLESAYHLCQLAHSLLKRSGNGSIVLVYPALNQLAKNFACEWANGNICTNSVSPWYIETSLTENVKLAISPILVDDATEIADARSFTEEVISLTPLRRVGNPRGVSSLLHTLPVKIFVLMEV
ncbi:hypothetical protein EJ110_NYTH49331 [Nymphaea thermarum]|nr:hypothetical protein EJ110_NYTH49331 [Nymphaea thermarum]